VTVISGELVLQRSVGERILRTGESVIENPGDVRALLNRSATAARIVASELIREGRG
jgi:quercetin dioxygenase-like cupin family protein